MWAKTRNKRRKIPGHKTKRRNGLCKIVFYMPWKKVNQSLTPLCFIRNTQVRTKTYQDLGKPQSREVDDLHLMFPEKHREKWKKLWNTNLMHLNYQSREKKADRSKSKLQTKICKSEASQISKQSKQISPHIDMRAKVKCFSAKKPLLCSSHKEGEYPTF